MRTPSSLMVFFISIYQILQIETIKLLLAFVRLLFVFFSISPFLFLAFAKGNQLFRRVFIYLFSVYFGYEERDKLRPCMR